MRALTGALLAHARRRALAPVLAGAFAVIKLRRLGAREWAIVAAAATLGTMRAPASRMAAAGVTAVDRAIAYARSRGVTPVAALGNNTVDANQSTQQTENLLSPALSSIRWKRGRNQGA